MTLASLAVGAAGVGIIVMMIPKIIVLIREIIYSVYFNRVKMSEMIGVQIDLINTNIESLERGRGNKKVIARQKKIVDKLTKWKNRFAVKADTVTSMVSVQKDTCGFDFFQDLLACEIGCVIFCSDALG